MSFRPGRRRFTSDERRERHREQQRVYAYKFDPRRRANRMQRWTACDDRTVLDDHSIEYLAVLLERSMLAVATRRHALRKRNATK